MGVHVVLFVALVAGVNKMLNRSGRRFRFVKAPELTAKDLVEMRLNKYDPRRQGYPCKSFLE